MNISIGNIHRDSASAVYNHRHQVVSRGNKKTRVHITCREGKKLKKDFDVHVKLPGKKGWQTTYGRIDKKRWVPMEITGPKGKEIVFANINSVAKRTGVSKKSLQEVAKLGDLHGVEKAVQKSVEQQVKFESEIRDAVQEFQKHVGQKALIKVRNILEGTKPLIDELKEYMNPTMWKRRKKQYPKILRFLLKAEKGLAKKEILLWADAIGKNLYNRCLENQVDKEDLEKIESKFKQFLTNNGLDALFIEGEIMPSFRKKLARANTKAPLPFTEKEVSQMVDQVVPQLIKLRQQLGRLTARSKYKFAGLKVGAGKNEHGIHVEVDRSGLQINGHKYYWEKDLHTEAVHAPFSAYRRHRKAWQ